ncbi:poly(3-hydroxybutyrate) depolymerase [Halomonas sp. McH1-25]|uniref:extracellular catalytic domain type 2 short-chain-length polyhydroxyalkanoate depolymerase n=1 Tax=unclassified Halomonas TaxID=2609666 RepID=UPI001EF650D4|nr:poly(3-hydroxybutyrate) depolymerase [Halomonas sp. McH1-25]MCP1343668.1 poly(3-hydroxybutyrate) depolymerase [Halomonas sp. FL8]MCP1361947.1 poly(3-hydroxybutyrate) depolymerase [Halomonas sp. BBD45]
MNASALSAVLMLAMPAASLAESATSPAAALPVMNIERDAISAMGVSSGGYMATQLAVAWPARFSGLAVFAAGPWGCAQGILSQALTQCMQTRFGPPDLESLQSRHADYADNGLVGAADELARQRVYLWHGDQDGTLDPQLGSLLAEQYRTWLGDPDVQLKTVKSPRAAHGWPVASSPAAVDCALGGSPYLLGCDMDGAGQALQWLYGDDLQPPTGDERGMLMPFDQSPFYDGRRLADQGYVYVPKVCEEGASCALTVALHGCDMSAAQIGEAFVRESGLNAWAAANRIVVLYPQAKPSLPNPKACWDWWGYDESSWQRDPLYDTRQGRQVQAIKAMVDHLAGI